MRAVAGPLSGTTGIHYDVHAVIAAGEPTPDRRCYDGKSGCRSVVRTLKRDYERTKHNSERDHPTHALHVHHAVHASSSFSRSVICGTDT